MAMLADRKRKQKFDILDRNVNKSNNWSKDSNKFGQKMLERMGWKEGKGLGRNEDGLTDYVKVAYKNNSKGVGFKESVEWSAQQDNFNALLENLNNAKDDVKDKTPKEIKSLEEKSQNSRARVHYRKFTRGKDLSRYSEKDLANILGKKTLTKIPKQDSLDTKEKGGNNELFTIATSSMVDYFKNKMNSSLYKNQSNENFNESEDEHVSYGFGFNDKPKNAENEDNSAKQKSETLEIVDDVQNTPSKKKRKSKSKKCKKTKNE